MKCDYQNMSNLCMTCLLEHWLTQTPPPTLIDLIEALKSPAIGHGDIVSNIEVMIKKQPD